MTISLHLFLCYFVTHLTFYIVTAYGRRGSYFLEKLLQTTTSSSIITNEPKTRNIEVIKLDLESVEVTRSSSMDPIDIQIFYPAAYNSDITKESITTSQFTTTIATTVDSKISQYPIIQIFHYQQNAHVTTETTTMTTLEPKNSNFFPFQLIPFGRYLESNSHIFNDNGKSEIKINSANESSFLGSLLPFFSIGNPPQATTSKEHITKEHITKEPITKSTKSIKTVDTTISKCDEETDEENDDDDNNDDDDDESDCDEKQLCNNNKVKFVTKVDHIYLQRQPWSINSYNHYNSLYGMHNNYAWANNRQYVEMPYYNNPNCRFPYAQNYWYCNQIITTISSIREKTRKPTRRLKTTTETTSTTTTTTTSSENIIPYFKLIPFIVASGEQQTTEQLITTTRENKLPYQVPFISVIQLSPLPNAPEQIHGEAPVLLTTAYPSPITPTTAATTSTTTSSTVTTTMLTKATTLTTNNTTFENELKTNLSAREIAGTNAFLRITTRNMHCFAVNPNCHPEMSIWSDMIQHTSTTRFTKRYWNATTISPKAKEWKSNSTTQQKAVATTRRSRTTTEFYYDYTELDTRVYFFGRCNITVMNEKNRLLVNILFYCSSGWIIFCVLLTIIVNSIYGEFGAHRWLDAYQEFAFMVLYIFMGVFVLKPHNQMLCIATTMTIMFFLMFSLCISFMQAFWLSSIIKGSSERNGRLPILVNYVWPLVVATIVMLASFFTQYNDYGSTKVHCFCEIFSSLFWTFTIAAWILWFFVLLRCQLAVTACRQSRPAVDIAQLYWAKKSCKAMPILISWFLMSFFALMFAVDLQLLWMSITYTIITIIFGIFLFYFHTQNHIRTNNGIASKTHLGLYRICPPKRHKLLTSSGEHHSASATNRATSNVNVNALHRSHSIGNTNPASYRHGPLPPLPSIHPIENDTHRRESFHLSRRESAPITVSGEPSPAPNPHAPPVTFVLPSTNPGLSRDTEKREAGNLSTNNVNHDNSSFPVNRNSNMLSQPTHNETIPTSAQAFYDWLMDRNETNIHESENILFHPRPV